MRARQQNVRRRGITLIELLVVMSIMMLLAVVAVPMMRPAMESRQVRETARAVNVFLGAVRNRAIESGRPAGVLIERLRFPNPNDATMPIQQTEHSRSGVSLQQVEIPPPYSGDFIDSRVRLQDWTRDRQAGTYYFSTLVLKVKVRSSDFMSGTIRYDDIIQLNGQGPWFRIVRDPAGRNFPVNPAMDNAINFVAGTDSNGDKWIDDCFLTLTADPREMLNSPWPGGNPNSPELVNLSAWSAPVSFMIYRQPFSTATGSIVALRSAVQPLQMPRDLVIDLESSGTDNRVYDDEEKEWKEWFSPDDQNSDSSDGIRDLSGVIIVFSPSGSVQGVICSRKGRVRVTEPIYLLLGKRDRMGPTLPEDGLANWQDMSNLWVTLNPQNGLVSVSQVFADASAKPPHVNAAGILRPENLDESRRLARRAQFNAGGR